jgi:endonuclease-3
MPALTLANTVRELRQHYGAPEGPPSIDPFELVLWENIAYLATPERRHEAFELLKRMVGTQPRAILAASQAELEAVTGHGILAGKFADKLRACARISLEKFGGDLDAAIRKPLPDAKRALQAFPGIGEPGAEKILLFSGHYALLAPESNGLRVLVRLGLVPEEKSYAKTYAAARDMAEGSGVRGRALQTAHQLLMQHGQTLCKRERPHCDECPLSIECAYARAQAKARKGK